MAHSANTIYELDDVICGVRRANTCRSYKVDTQTMRTATKFNSVTRTRTPDFEFTVTLVTWRVHTAGQTSSPLLIVPLKANELNDANALGTVGNLAQLFALEARARRNTKRALKLRKSVRRIDSRTFRL